jgi:hypothetical protein
MAGGQSCGFSNAKLTTRKKVRQGVQLHLSLLLCFKHQPRDECHADNLQLSFLALIWIVFLIKSCPRRRIDRATNGINNNGLCRRKGFCSASRVPSVFEGWLSCDRQASSSHLVQKTAKMLLLSVDTQHQKETSKYPA